MRLIHICFVVSSLFAHCAYATTASYYADKFNGRKTATGETFSNKAMTCASNHYQLGAYVEVTHAKTGESIICKVNDRIGKKGRIDLTKKGFAELASLSAGVIDVDVRLIDKDDFDEQKIIQLAQND